MKILQRTSLILTDHFINYVTSFRKKLYKYRFIGTFKFKETKLQCVQ